MVGRITTISVSDSVKEILEREKGDMNWDEFLLILVNEYKRKKREEGLRELMKILTEDDIKEIEKSHEEMHEEFKL
ncbi:hypothetical protein BFU36_12400 [Sulfolobus sp. A20]|uniref:antitoxin VapB family protein n=1 Tax=Sulfolobaceae TaxID=118883 RepID=UPI0008462565|nr:MULTISPECIES: antitoxin VapB family protein [unclassified Sulfolobus]TRM74728.1 hypothetical protein DJ532_12070 [Sulfolobus sp. A20-N-F8]TRM75976.1 hypothetical protein DJ523_01945 [Sulfolobus sp. E5]TRM79599.1 hypothetical protein DJ528_00530 [Sulfolobus sp. B5]TRM82581.1 hypothetical protein DJ531_09255 [Sulfolobus sp. A20-N-F6]TRM93727.1 hypothetical protein DJ526_03075 [Sulfolobus sp. A20-N-G8]TRN01744.1 hypothetical protein DJ527_05080 [Sulfolobus sp. F1]TRN03980.1 hypothetical prot